MVEGLEFPIGLLLFFEGGYLTLLEGHATGDRDTLAVDFTMASFGEITTDYLALRRE